MNIILDLIGASLIGGVLLLTLLNLNIYSSHTKFSSDSELQLQQNAKTLAEMLNYDLRKIGYNYTGTSIITGEKRKISFYSDIDNNGSVDVVTYILGDSTAASYTTNPRDKVLYRVVNNDTLKGHSLGLVDLQFAYKKNNGVTTTQMDSVSYIDAEIWIETTQPVNGKYSFTYWEMKINPRNI